MSTGKPRRPSSTVLISIALVAVSGLLVWKLYGYLQAEPKPGKKVVQQIQIIRPPPPPPETEPPPPPPPEEEVDVPEPQAEPESTPNETPPAGDQLGLDADGTGGADGFGLVGRKGGRDLLATGSSSLRWYAGVVRDRILEELGKDDRLRRGSYRVRVQAWLAADGSVERIQMTNSTGDPERDKAFRSSLERVARLPQPPAGTPMPMTLVIQSRA